MNLDTPVGGATEFCVIGSQITAGSLTLGLHGVAIEADCNEIIFQGLGTS